MPTFTHPHFQRLARLPRTLRHPPQDFAARPPAHRVKQRPVVLACLMAGLTASLTAGLATPSQAQTPPGPASARDTAPNTTAPTAPNTTRHYQWPAGPLADSLNRYAAEAGVVLVFNAQALQGLRAPALQGAYTLAAGFAALLAGSGLEAVALPTGGYLVRARASAQASTAEATASPEAVRQPWIAADMPVVRASAGALATAQNLDRDMLRHLPAVNGDLGSLLKLNPNIQYSESQNSSLTGGEIAPAEISIHGAKPYQNALLLDGVSISNDLDPGYKSSTSDPNLIPGQAQSLAIDSSILCRVDVKDSNVSAEHGSFTGGVVDARLCNARKSLGGSISLAHTSHRWTHAFVDPNQQAAYEASTTEDLQPKFDKWTLRTVFETRPTAEWGLLVSHVRQRSTIPLKVTSGLPSGEALVSERDQQREQQTTVIKADYSPAGGVHKAELSLVLAPSSNTYYRSQRDGRYDIEGGGVNLAARWVSVFAAATVTQQLAYSQNEQSRDSEVAYYKIWRWSSEKYWGDPTGSNPNSWEGGVGDLNQSLQSLKYQAKAQFKPLSTWQVKHEPVVGLNLGQRKAQYERPEDYRHYLTVSTLPASLGSCLFSDGSRDTEACSNTAYSGSAVGQFFRRLMTYRSGSFELDNRQWGAFAEDQMRWGDFGLRLGVRVDRDDLSAKTQVGPRLTFSWQASDALQLDLGANRYQGRNLFAYALQEKANTLLYTQTRTTTSMTWGAATQSKPLNRLDSMETPYDDELTLGATYESEALAGPLSLRWVRRDGQNQIVRRLVTQNTSCNSNQCYVYTNDGQSLTRDTTLSWSSAKAFKTGPLATRGWVAFNHSKVQTNHSSYEDPFSTDALNDVPVLFEGRLVRYSELPANNFNRPWTLRVGALSAVPSQQLKLSSILRVRDGYQAISNVGSADVDGTTVDVYERRPLSRSVALDGVLQWTPRIGHGQHLDIKLTVENITNRRNQTSVGTTTTTYERGRTFALELGYSF